MSHKFKTILFSNRYLSSIVCNLSFIFVLAGCAKETTNKVETTSNSSTQSIIASDELTLNNEFDQAVDDAMEILSNHNATIAGALVDTSQINLGVIEINYFGYEPDGTKSRTASDSIHESVIGGHVIPWGNPGATATVTFGDANNKAYEVIFKTNNTSVTLTGSATLTNIYGGLLQNLTATDSLVEHIRASVSYTYNDNVTAIQLYKWNLNQVRSFTKSDTTINAGSRGDTAIKSISNVGSWGINRYGDSTYSNITATIIQNISNLKLSYNPISGSEAIENIAEPIVCNYGVSQQGVPMSSGKPYGFIITWVNNGGQAQNVIGYYY